MSGANNSANINTATVLPRLAGGTGRATPSFRSMVIRTFNATGTYTPTANMSYCIIMAVGGGGSGGSVQGVVGQGIAAGAGGSGGFVRLVASAATIGASKAITIGAAGTTPAAGANNGNAGGNTTVGSLLTAGGGGGGLSGTASATLVICLGGAGGTATGGNVNIPGARGQTGVASSLFTFTATGGSGPLSIGGKSGTNSGGSGFSGQGSGGGGAANLNSATAFAGGAARAGFVIIYEFIL
jgi:hypothetical protein